MEFNQYNLKARIYPAILCIIPFMILYHFFLNNILGDFLNFIVKIKWIDDISISVIFIYLLAQIGRLIGKEVYEKIYFKNELNMPTTSFLMCSNSEYTSDYKSKIYQKIKKDFNLQLSLKEEEKNDEIKAKKKIVEAVGLIRGKVKNGRLLLQHTIEYGFWRNLIGGSTIALLFSLINIYFFKFITFNKIACIVSIVTSLIYLIPVVLSKVIITRLGNLYAKRLIQEYMVMK